MRRLATLALVAAMAPGSTPSRPQAIERGLRFIYKTASDPKNFTEYGSDYLWCFHIISATSLDPNLARMALAMGRERAAAWRRENASVPQKADADDIADLAFGSYAAEQLGLPDERLKNQIRQSAPRYLAQDYLGFDPTREPPPDDLPALCKQCKRENARGATVCHHCGAKLKIRSRYDIWCDALITTYMGDRFGVTLGARYRDVIRWLPQMRPYRPREDVSKAEFYEILYAVTHVVYT